MTSGGTDHPRYVLCPTCGKQVRWSRESRWRPFCSERCKLIDLGEWIAERHGIPGEPHTPHDDDDSA
ncbi:MAG: DNA gyrase inhibitor YacG [Gammaproteobacteria bacterium]